MDVMMRRRELMGMQGTLKTVTGSIVTVNDAMSRNAKSLVVNFAPIQAAGTPAPDNVLPISGWTGVTGYRAGGNVWDEEWEVGSINDTTGEDEASSTRIRSKNHISCRPGIAYCFVSPRTGNDVRIAYYKADKSFIRLDPWQYNGAFTTPDEAYYMRFYMAGGYGKVYNYDISINYPSTDTTYHPYSGTTYPVDWTDIAGTVYGGYVDLVSGVLVAEWGMVDLGTLTWTLEYNGEASQLFAVYSGYPSNMTFMGSLVCTCFLGVKKQTNTMNVNEISITNSQAYYIPRAKTSAGAYASAADFKTAMSGQKLAYKLYSPITYQLTPQTIIAMLRGTNNVWANTNGNVSLTYYAQ